MGTNFYVEQKMCECCGYTPPRVHLGKSSIGWKFLFRWNPALYTSWDELRLWLLDKTIHNEYNEEVSWEEFVKRVEYKQYDVRSKPHQNTHGGLEYKKVDGYDFCDKEFS